MVQKSTKPVLKHSKQFEFPNSVQIFFSDYASHEKTATEVVRKYRHDHRSKMEMERSFAWVQGKSGLPWLELAIQFPFEEMLVEVKRLRHRFVSHRSGGKKGYSDGNRGWKALTLHGLGPEKTGDYLQYGYQSDAEAPYVWTEIADQCPITTKFFKEIYPRDRYFRVRFSMIEAGGFIYPHVDRDYSYLDEVNMALNHPEGCFLKMKGQGYVPFRPGKTFILDVSNTHAVVNLSNEDRYHMIVHAETIHNERWRELIVRSYRNLLKLES